jgi:hypothetical protein
MEGKNVHVSRTVTWRHVGGVCVRLHVFRFTSLDWSDKLLSYLISSLIRVSNYFKYEVACIQGQEETNNCPYKGSIPVSEDCGQPPSWSVPAHWLIIPEIFTLQVLRPMSIDPKGGYSSTRRNVGFDLPLRQGKTRKPYVAWSISNSPHKIINIVACRLVAKKWL